MNTDDNMSSIYVFDLDGTLCNTKGNYYEKATPKKDRIKIVNELYDDGHIITYWTARGGTTGIDWTDLTKEQLNNWGAKHHGLVMKKPSYDLFICDKAINSREFFIIEEKDEGNIP